MWIQIPKEQLSCFRQTAAVLGILHPYVRGLGTADIPRTAADRVTPGREDLIAAGTTANCPAKADNQEGALHTHTTSTGIGETPDHIDTRLATFLYHHHTLME